VEATFDEKCKIAAAELQRIREAEEQEQKQLVKCPDCGADLKVILDGGGGFILMHIRHNV
jgi:Zn finger protein HypA/HybF involved in hydrogenase expression